MDNPRIKRVTVCEKHVFYTEVEPGTVCDTHGIYMLPGTRWTVVQDTLDGDGEPFTRHMYRPNGDYTSFRSYRAAYYHMTGN